ncbi:MAG TPA: glycosyltransferase, partial [Bacteroidia bacterium]|nr:glycosyltransferase [Bacteroidia bacterium]
YENYFDGSAFAKISNRNLEIKKKTYAGKNITIVSPSRYLLNCCKESQIFEGKTHTVIPNSVPATIYHPLSSRESIRKNLSLKESDQLWVFACAELDYFRKGADILLKAFSDYKNENIRLLIVGNPGKQVKPDDKRIRFTGHIGENKLVELLNAADALIHTSREDNFPNIILESLFCGTPVLSTDEGGVSEMIRDGVNGCLTSAEELPAGFQRILSKQFDREKISTEAQAVFSAEVQALRFVQLYEEISLRNPR